MLARLFWHWLKWPAVTIMAGYLTYQAHDNIERFVNGVMFYTAEAAEGFVDKEHAFRLKLHFERNGAGNLETYVLSYSDKLPAYKRLNGIMVGDAQYNFYNFNKHEKSLLCSEAIPQKVYRKLSSDRRRNLQQILAGLYKFLGD